MKSILNNIKEKKLNKSQEITCISALNNYNYKMNKAKYINNIKYFSYKSDSF